jgi:8-oxo-dGTP diphosphatase
MKAQDYVVGLLFSPDQKTVAMVRKNKPAWQAGKLNGIGGKIEPNELGLEAMTREFKEETGVSIMNWERFLTMRYSNSEAGLAGQIIFYRATSDMIAYVRTMEAEAILTVQVDDVLTRKVECIPNMYWITGLALDRTTATAQAFAA